MKEAAQTGLDDGISHVQISEGNKTFGEFIFLSKKKCWPCKLSYAYSRSHKWYAFRTSWKCRFKTSGNLQVIVNTNRLAHWEHGIRLDILIARYLRVQVFVARWTNRGGALSFRQKQRFQPTDSSMPGDVTIRQEIVRRWIWFHRSPLLCWFKKWQIEKCHIWYPMVSPNVPQNGKFSKFHSKVFRTSPKVLLSLYQFKDFGTLTLRTHDSCRVLTLSWDTEWILDDIGHIPCISVCCHDIEDQQTHVFWDYGMAGSEISYVKTSPPSLQLRSKVYLAWLSIENGEIMEDQFCT